MIYYAAYEKNKIVHYFSHIGELYPLIYTTKKAFTAYRDVRKIKIVEVKKKNEN